MKASGDPSRKALLKRATILRRTLPAPLPSPSSRCVDTALFDYHLPASAIAQVPADRRDESRLLFVDRKSGLVSDHRFTDLPDLLRRKTAFVRNNARVLRARLLARRPTGGQVECLLLHPANDGKDWWCLLRPGRRLPVGATFEREGWFRAIVREKSIEGPARVSFEIPPAHGDNLVAVAEAIGEIPLPPYIRRESDDPRRALDAERYNTIYADRAKTVAAAAPTAGLHFTPEVIASLESHGHCFNDVTLHVGLDTFRPIATETIEAHKIHRETYEIPPATRRILENKADWRVLAVGTTSLRTIEDFARRKLPPAPSDRDGFTNAAEIFIYPPAHFRTEALLTNFHLPRSTLMCLVAAFLTPGSTDGIGWLREIYQSALALGYRFYSYGDAMLIL